MKQTISYEGLPETDRERKAVKDCMFYLSHMKLRRTMVKVAQLCDNLKDFRFNAMLIGIEGYPAEAFYNRYHSSNLVIPQSSTYLETN